MVYSIILIFLLILTSNIKKRKKNKFYFNIKNRNKNVGSTAVLKKETKKIYKQVSKLKFN